MVDFSNREDVEPWLQSKRSDVPVVFATRAALRAFPTAMTLLHTRLGVPQRTKLEDLLPILRALSVAWTETKYLTRSDSIRDAAAAVSGAPFPAIATALSARAAVQCILSRTTPHVSFDASEAIIAAFRAGKGMQAFENAMQEAMVADARALDAGMTTRRLGSSRLWPSGLPQDFDILWRELETAMLNDHRDWSLWTKWYRARLNGSWSTKLIEVARATISPEIWDEGPRAVNAEVARLIEDYGARVERNRPTPSPDEFFDSQINSVPLQGPGPRFRATEEGPVDRAPPADLDAEGNDTKTIDQLKPFALRCAADLKTRLPPNQFGELLSAVDLYIAALDPGEGKTIEWGEVWGQGVILQNAAAAADRKVDERILPALEDPSKTALESLLTIHGPMVLASRDGAKFSEAASNFRLTREQQEALRAAALRLAEQLGAAKDVITPRAAASVTQATETIGQGSHPERGSVYGLATVKNISVVLIGGAAVATPALIGAFLGSVAIGALAGAPFSFVAVEAVKKSAAFNALVTQLGAKLDTISDDELRAWLEERGRRYAPFRRFVARNSEPLRKIAEATPELKWMLRYIDFIADGGDGQ